MSLRADRSSTGEQQVVAGDLLGGLVTNVPAHRVPANASPDLVNILLHRGAAQNRGAMAPIIRQQPGVCAWRNTGEHSLSRSQSVLGATDVDYVIVPGCAHAGHRSAWDDDDVRNGITLDFFIEIDDLTAQHGGSGVAAVSPYGPAPFTVQVRPILSKGPIKRIAEVYGAMPGTGGWSTTERWGPISANHHAMPFCVYLRNTGTGTDPVWAIVFSFHYSDGVNWQLKSLTTDLAAIGGIRTKTRYHIVAGYDIAGDTAVLRVGGLFAMDSPSYVTVSGPISGGGPVAMALCTTGPVQLFDCPQEFIEAPFTPSATRPPGLGINNAASGGYWFGTLRFEGSIEDIVIYRGLVAGGASGTLNRTGRVDPERPVATRLQHWPIESANDRMADEIAGLGNHFYLSPSGPIFSSKDGGFGEGGGLVFNGSTAYALVEMSEGNPIAGNYADGRGGNTNWRTLAYDPPTISIFPGAWEKNVKNNYAHGLEVAFWPESIEPNNEQVVCEAHGALRIAVSEDGFIKAYTRNTAAWPTAPSYVLIGQSTTRVVPGRRYHVIAMRLDATSTRLFVNGVLEDFRVVVASAATSQPVGGLTVGIGSIGLNSTTADATGRADAATPTADQVWTDIRTVFFGRVETVRVIVGSIPQSTTDGVVNAETYQGFDYPDYLIPFERLYTLAETALVSYDGGTLPNIGAGHVAGGLLTDGYTGVAAPIETSVSPTQYAVRLSRASLKFGLAPVQRALQYLLRSIGIWDFDAEVSDVGDDDCYVTRVEFLSPNVYNDVKHLHMQRRYTQDKIGFGGSVQLRCFESDLLTENPSTYTLAEWRRRNVPYMTRGPRRLAPCWRPGMLSPPLGANPIAMVATWQIETTNDHLLVAACRRSLYWVKPRFSKLNPFGSGVSLWSGGQPNDRCMATTTALGVGLTWAAHVAVIDCWIRPERLDGNRFIVMHGDRIGAGVRYLVFLNDGQVEVWGTLSNGNTWRWVSSILQATPTVQNTSETPVKLKAWNHLVIRIGDSVVTCWVNGQSVPMASHLSFGSTIASANIPSATRIWVGGPSSDQEVMSFTTLPSTTTRLAVRPFHGQIAYLREASSFAHLPWIATRNGAPPSKAPTTTTDRYDFRLDVDTGWSVPNATGGEGLAIELRELVEIASDGGDFQSTPASHVVFRDRLLIAHPSGRPRAVRFIDLAADRKFVATTLGIVPSVEQGLSYQWGDNIQFVPVGGATAWLGTEAVEVFCSFVNYQAGGEESELVSLGVRTGPGSVCERVTVWNLPLSRNPDVTARRIYLSISGVGQPLSGIIYFGELGDNTTRSIELRSKIGLGLAAPLPATRLPAFVSSRIAVAQGTVLLAGIAENGNVIAASGELPGYFPIVRLTALDSEDGQAVLGVAGHLGGVYVFKRNGCWQFAVTPTEGLVSSSVRLVNASAACAGGTTIYDNVVYGATDRGVWMFDGANFAYVSLPLEGVYEDVDVTDPGLLAQQGVYLYRASQYWLSVRDRGEKNNQTIFVLHTGGARGWTRLRVPPHVAMSRVFDKTDRPAVAIGTTHGQILVHDDAQGVEGLVDAAHARGAQTLSGSATLSTSTSFTDGVANFDTTHRGLRGVPIELFSAASGVSLGYATIRENTATSIVFAPEIATGGALITYLIGGWEARWSSGWMAPQQMGSFLKVEGVDLTFDPNENDLVLENQSAVKTTATAREFQVTGSEPHNVNQTTGFMEQPVAVKLRNQGAFHRIRFGTNGPRKRFAVTAYAIRYAPVGTRGGPT